MQVDARVRSKALAILREGRCTIVEAQPNVRGGIWPPKVVAHVRGHQGKYAVDLDADGHGDCTCRDGAGAWCGHGYATRLVTRSGQ